MTKPDPGLSAVARVRGVRERDTRLGLQQAMAEQRLAEARMLALEAHLHGITEPDNGTVASYVVHHELVRATSDALSAATAESDAATGLAASARAHWQADKTRLSAVEMLLERRAEERRDEARRREARDLDEVVIQQFLRSQGPDDAA